MTPRLEKSIANLVRQYPSDSIDEVCKSIETQELLSRATISLVLSKIVNPALRYQMNIVLQHAANLDRQLLPLDIVLAIRSAKEAYKIQDQTEIAFAWTGPETDSIAARKTEQVLLELIQNSHQELIIVSFAVYNARNILNALADAIERGVRVRVIIEDNGKKLTNPAISAFSRKIFRQAEIYRWPLENRPSEDGKFGSFHAKIAVADEHSLFVTSANLTQYAMELNIEAGVLINSGELPSQVHAHLRKLLSTQFRKISL